MALRCATPAEISLAATFPQRIANAPRTHWPYMSTHQARGTRPAVPGETLVMQPADGWAGAAEGWWRWGQMFEPALDPVNAALVDLAEIRPAQRVLDVATGFGEPALTATRRVGPAGSVVVAGSEDQALAGASFDAVLCRFGLSFIPDLAGTLKRLLTLLVPGGRLAAAAWGSPARCPALTVPLTTLRQYLELPPVPPGAPGLFGLGAEGVIEDELNFAGFTHVRSCHHTLLFEWTSPEAFARFHQVAAVPLLGVAVRPGKHEDELRAALLGAAQARAGRDGGVRLEADVVVVAGRRAPSVSDRHDAD